MLILQKRVVSVLAQLEGYFQETKIFCCLEHNDCHIYTVHFQDVCGWTQECNQKLKLVNILACRNEPAADIIIVSMKQLYSDLCYLILWGLQWKCGTSEFQCCGNGSDGRVLIALKGERYIRILNWDRDLLGLQLDFDWLVDWVLGLCDDTVSFANIMYHWMRWNLPVKIQKTLKTLATKVSDLAEVHIQYHSKQVFSVLELDSEMRQTEI